MKKHFSLRTKLLLCLCAGLCLALCHGCTAPAETQIDFFAMDTYISLTAYGPNAAEALRQAERETYRLESLISVTRPDSEVYRANHAETRTPVSDTTRHIIDAALEICARTNGALDISLYPVTAAWGFTTDAYQVPAAETIDALLRQVDYRQIDITDAGLRLSEGMMIDLGAVAKGYIGDAAADIMAQNDIASAIMNFGGDVRAVGAKPDGSPWRVGIQNPLQPANTLGMLHLRDQAAVTSGGYERFFEQGGETYGHIIDSQTGAPTRNGLVSVTVVGASGTLCDGLSTALFVMGKEGAIAHHAAHSDFDMVLVTEDAEVIITPGLQGHFTLLDTRDYRLVVTGE